ncbi:2-oxo acid dehydrogenase subunit E2 [Aurantiacibacter zhengii]|uniref:2-oxo acid dehydrogenase subunit E2 n=2 Tax=Aurantiacibacter zhengii TaxID=2307003 RepID=A0A418NSG5_9SPHN|nr:2-oxo acid dehydrogenase subunit E2 [Aurantiacibacter zhengii]
MHASSSAGHTTAVPLRGPRRMIADKMVASLREAAQLTHHATAQASALVAAKQSCADAGENVSIEDLVMFATIRTLADFPQLNARLVNQEVHTGPQVHLSIAIALPGDLLVAPAIFDAQDLSLTELRAARQDLARRAKVNKLTVSEMTGGTFTISNLGLTRVEHFTPILNIPQVAILGLGRMVERPVNCADGSIAFAPHLGLSLTFDHRAVDGAPAAAFLTALCITIESGAIFA